MKFNKTFRQLTLVFGVVFSSASFASVNDDLNKFFNQIGGGANYSSGQIIKAQSAGYLVGGSFYARVPVRNIQLISLTLPDIKAGCGGIDAYLGAFSFINSDQLKAMAKQILSNAVGYAFDLALETLMPQVKSVKDFLMKLANDVNNLNVSTCQAAQGIIGGLIPKSLAQSYDLCQKLGTENNVFADWAKARQGCGVGGRTDDVLNNPKSDIQKKQTPRNKNITWQSFNRINQVVSNDRELKELMMTIVGTVVYDKKGNMTVLPSLGANDNLINTLLYGGSTTMYRCNDTSECLSPKKSDVTINQKNALVSKVNETLSSIFDKVETDTKLTSKEEQLILGTRVPLLAYVKDLAMLKMDKSSLLSLSEYISLDFAIGYIDGLIQTTEIASANTLTSEEESKRFQDNLNSVRERLGQSLSKVQIQQDAYIAKMKELDVIRKGLSSEVMQNIQSN